MYAYMASGYAMEKKGPCPPNSYPVKLVENKEQEFELDPKMVIYVSSTSMQ